MKYGVRDINALEATLRLRPDGHAKQQGDAYIANVIVRAQDLLFPRAQDPGSPTGTPHIPFNLQKVTRFAGEPRIYTLTIDGIELRLTSLQLGDREAFKQKHFDRLNRFPSLPSGRGAPAEWDAIVQQIADMAEDITPPADGTREGALALAIKRAIEDLPIGDPEDFGRCAVIATHERKRWVLFTTDMIVAALALHDSRPEREEIARLLPKLGCVTHEHRFRRKGAPMAATVVWRIRASKRQMPGGRSRKKGLDAASGPDFTKPDDPPKHAGPMSTDEEETFH